jgi:hypothetical protein
MRAEPRFLAPSNAIGSRRPVPRAWYRCRPDSARTCRSLGLAVDIPTQTGTSPQRPGRRARTRTHSNLRRPAITREERARARVRLGWRAEAPSSKLQAAASDGTCNRTCGTALVRTRVAPVVLLHHVNEWQLLAVPRTPASNTACPHAVLVPAQWSRGVDWPVFKHRDEPRRCTAKEYKLYLTYHDSGSLRDTQACKVPCTVSCTHIRCAAAQEPVCTIRYSNVHRSRSRTGGDVQG